jgi:hypothetical protein
MRIVCVNTVIYDLWIMRILCVQVKNKPCRRYTSYMRLIPWIHPCGSEHVFYTGLCHNLNLPFPFSYSLGLVHSQQGPTILKLHAWSSWWAPRCFFLTLFSPTSLQRPGAGLFLAPRGEDYMLRPLLFVPDRRCRIIPEVVLVRRWAVGVLGIWRGEGLAKGWNKGGQFTSNLRPRWTDPVAARRVPSK